MHVLVYASATDLSFLSKRQNEQVLLDILIRASSEVLHEEEFSGHFIDATPFTNTARLVIRVQDVTVNYKIKEKKAWECTVRECIEKVEWVLYPYEMKELTKGISIVFPKPHRLGR